MAFRLYSNRSYFHGFSLFCHSLLQQRVDETRMLIQHSNFLLTKNIVSVQHYNCAIILLQYLLYSFSIKEKNFTNSWLPFYVKIWNIGSKWNVRKVLPRVSQVFRFFNEFKVMIIYKFSLITECLFKFFFYLFSSKPINPSFKRPLK